MVLQFPSGTRTIWRFSVQFNLRTSHIWQPPTGLWSTDVNFRVTNQFQFSSMKNSNNQNSKLNPALTVSWERSISAVHIQKLMYLIHKENHAHHKTHAPRCHSQFCSGQTFNCKNCGGKKKMEWISSFRRTVEQRRHYWTASRHQRMQPRELTITFRMRGVLCDSSSLTDLMYLCSLSQTPAPLQPKRESSWRLLSSLRWSSLHMN